ncbi:hypothetical protein GEU84_009740 [Fertoebacter nigrum]|uniref:Uncharacterized protein n=1 Tax=Fertoeibacter niger TaxID=2656921 RepID=A0A8X8GUM9_9RHOB|nr:hypothetical protein [Fertoeibacter niger]NUB44664.1 hypothetical protein [Fertoeibacter niger]
MSSQATPQLLDARRRVAQEQYPDIIDALTERYVQSMRARNQQLVIDDELRKELREELEDMIRSAAGSR